MHTDALRLSCPSRVGRAVAVALLLAVGPSSPAQDGPDGVPGEPADPVAARLEPLFADRVVQRATVGVHLVDVATGEVRFAHHADRALLPASTAKVITAAAALDALGPSHTFTTDVLIDGERRGDVLEGDLVLRMGGDPTMVADRLWRILRDVRVDGVATVTGDLVVDTAYFADEPLIPGWDEPRDLERGPSYFPAIGAANLEFGAAVVVVRPAEEAGQPATLGFETPSPGYLVVDGEVTTGPAGSRVRLDLERQVAPGRLTFTVSGTVPAGGDASRVRRAVADPTAFTIGAIRHLLRTVGPRIEGDVVAGVAPTDAERLRRVYSPPLASILMDTNKYSSNYMAETVLRAVGAEIHGEGSTAAGLRVVHDHLARLGLPEDAAHLANGSGLSRETRVTPEALTTVLRAAALDDRIAPELVASLAIGGRDGTLLGRLGELDGHARGKTGTLGGVHALAGFLQTEADEQLAYAIVFNDVRGGLYPVKTWMDDLLREAARLPPVDRPRAAAPATAEAVEGAAAGGVEAAAP